MVDYHELMHLLSVPRPNGSRAERETLLALCTWLEQRSIPYRRVPFRLYPYFMEANGAWLIFSRTLLALAIWLNWGWPAAVIALAGMFGGVLDVAKGWPLVTWIGWREGENLVLDFDALNPERRLIIGAHYDSKTELFDHDRRAFFTRRLQMGMALTLILGLLGPLNAWLEAGAFQIVTYWLAVALSFPLLVLAWGLGLNLLLGRFSQPSQGAVDNGAACAVLLGLAQRLASAKIELARTQVTLALFTGEEVNMQGSAAYVRQQDFPIPLSALNLELVGQNGPYILWSADGNAFTRVPTSQSLNDDLSAAVLAVTGERVQWQDYLNSDTYSFLSAGIPAATLGSLDNTYGVGELHRPTDNVARVAVERLPECVDILAMFIKAHDDQATERCTNC